LTLNSLTTPANGADGLKAAAARAAAEAKPAPKQEPAAAPQPEDLFGKLLAQVGFALPAAFVLRSLTALDRGAGAWDGFAGEQLLGLGLWCCSDAPQERPVMTVVAARLARLAAAAGVAVACAPCSGAEVAGVLEGPAAGQRAGERAASPHLGAGGGGGSGAVGLGGLFGAGTASGGSFWRVAG
jgi:hypothetical protein